MRKSAAVGAAALVLGTCSLATSTDAADTRRSREHPTCHGKSATIVGTPGNDDIKGTSEPDVIVARGGNDNVKSLGGADTICLGAGDDGAITGTGDDWVSGGTGDDNLNNDFAGSSGADVGIGGTGDDFFFWGPDSGVIRAGDGRDAVAFFSAAGPGFRLDGGPGKDQIYFNLAGHHTFAAIDAVVGMMELDEDRSTFAAWENVTLASDDTSDWTYEGTDAAERVRLMSSSGRLVAHLAGGNDRVQVAVANAVDPSQAGVVHTLDGGDGTDTAVIDDYELSGSPTPQDCISIENVVTQSSGTCVSP